MKIGNAFFIAIAAALCMSACSSNSKPTGSVATAQDLDNPPQPQWSGRIRANVVDRLNEADSTRERSYGTLVWTPGKGPAQSIVKLDFTYAGSARELTWGIFFGPCGNASLPVITLSDFPELEMSTGGRAESTATISVDMPLTGAFHVEVFKDRSGAPEFLVACGNLKFSR